MSGENPKFNCGGSTLPLSIPSHNIAAKISLSPPLPLGNIRSANAYRDRKSSYEKSLIAKAIITYIDKFSEKPNHRV